MTKKMTLEEALREVLQDDNKISKFEAKVLHELILADGKVSNEEKELLRQAISENQLDEEALKILSDMVLRSDMKYR